MRGVLYTVREDGDDVWCESWPIRKENEENLVRAERRLIRMMCGVTLVNREKSKDL